MPRSCSRVLSQVPLRGWVGRGRTRVSAIVAGAASVPLLFLGASVATAATTAASPGAPASSAAPAHPGPTGAPYHARTVDVLNAPYNASGDGTSNDRPAIQQAIDNVASHGGGTVVLPAGHTFLSGNLMLGNAVTLEIDGTLLQSQNAGDYTYTPLLGRRAQGCADCAWYSTWFFNYPLVYAGDKHDVAVTGTGTIQSTQGSEGQTNAIIVVAIGFYDVHNFAIQGVHIVDSNAYNVTAWDSTFGLIKDLVINAVQANTDGINVKDSQEIRITGNTIDNRDDGIIVGSGYNDPRVGAWWQSHPTHGGSQNIEIDHNVDRLHPINAHPVGKAIAFIPWGTTAPDARWTEIKNINIHDNVLQAPMSVGCWCDNPYNDVKSNTDHSAIDNVRIVNNRYVNYDGTTPSHLDWIQYARITDLVDDFGKLSYSAFLNNGFENTGTAYWSTTGDAGAASTVDPSSGPLDPNARRWAAGFANGEWYGYVDGPSADSALYQGLGLNDAVDYQFQATVLTGGAPIRMFVQNTCTGQTIAQQTLTNTSSDTATLNFTAAGTCGDYHLGFDRASQPGQIAAGWALVDDANLTIADTVIDDTNGAFAYTGSWSKVSLPNAINDTYHWGLSQGSTATIAFTGSRASLLGLLRWEDGQADVYLDGAYRGRIDTYNVAFVDHAVLFDTGVLPYGPHSLKIVATGTANPDSTGNRIQLDALIVHP
jgi:hypothetical protein